jgi:hypothetical protein
MTRLFGRMWNLIFSHGTSAPGVSVKIENVFRECVKVIYSDSQTTLELNGERVGPKWQQIDMTIKSDVQVSSGVLSNLTVALKRRGYESVIYRVGEAQSIPEAERDEALAELKLMGYEFQVSPDRRTIRQARTPGLPPPSVDDAKKQAPRMAKLIQTLHGVRHPREVLAKSDAALL